MHSRNRQPRPSLAVFERRLGNKKHDVASFSVLRASSLAIRGVRSQPLSMIAGGSHARICSRWDFRSEGPARRVLDGRDGPTGLIP